MIAKLLFICLSVITNPGADLDRLALSGNPDPAAVATVLQAELDELKGQGRPQRCMDAFLAGELYRQAAALAPNQGYTDKALKQFRSMRVDFMDLPTGALGYIGEARVHLQKGDPEQSLAVLAPLLDAPGVTKIKRLAELESLEALLLLEPQRAISQARQLGEHAHWFLARAYAQQGDAEQALDFARNDWVVAHAPQYPRLQLIADLDALTDPERSAWAHALVQVGKRQDALAVLSEHAPAESARLYATLLQTTGDHQAAAVQWRRVIQSSDDPRVLLAYAACLASIAEDDPSQKPLALDTFRQVFNSDEDDALRTDALRRWVHLNGLQGASETLASHNGLVSTDPYLRYARAASQRDTAEAAFLLAELQAVTTDAEDPSIQGSAILLHAQINPDPRKALALLDEHWSALMTQPSLAEPAKIRRVDLWIELGMIDRAADQVLADPDARPPELLKVAEALADRYADGITDNTQQRVLLMTNAVLAAAPDDELTTLTAAKLMLRVEARADAVKVLQSLNISQAKPVLAEVLRETNRAQEALDVLVGQNTPEAAMQRGLSHMALNQADRALVEIRQARKESSPGSDFWWDATLALTTVQIRRDDRQAAQEILRVAEALYPVSSRPRLHTKLSAIKKELQP